MTSILNKKFIFLDKSIDAKQDLFNYVANEFKNQGIITDETQFIDGLNKREEQSPTGFENGIAIPHVQTDAVTVPTLAVIRTTSPIADYESMMPTNEVKLVFLIAVPKSAGDEHLKVLSTLATKLMDIELINELMVANEDGIVSLLSEDKKEQVQVEGESKGLILAVTACATGIAHTYMSAEAIEKIGAEYGYEVKVEKQGASGIEDKITAEDVARASGVILAHDVALTGLNRFEGLKFIDVKVAKPMHDPKGCFEEVLNTTKTYVATEDGDDAEEEQSLGAEMMQAMMTGISHMIPVIVAGGLLMGIAKLAALGIGGDELVQNLGGYLPLGSSPEGLPDPNFLYVFLAYLDKIGWTIMQFMYPVFAMYLAYSIGGKNALLPGLLGGIFAQGLHTTIWGFDMMPSGIMYPFVDSHTMSAVPSGFIGALALGFIAGYLVRRLNKIKIHKNLAAMKTMLIIPGVSVLVIVVVSMFVVEPVFGAFNMFLQRIITENSESQYIYGISIAAATAFDLGGPVNKAAGAVAMSLAGDGTIAMTARTLSIVIPPLGLGLATIIDRVMRTNIFSEEEKVVGSTSFLLGFLAISEGAIPFMLKNPLIVIPINVLGAIIGSVVAIALGAEMWLPLPAIWGWPLVDGSVLAYLIGLIVGVSFIAIANLLVRKVLNK